MGKTPKSKKERETKIFETMIRSVCGIFLSSCGSLNQSFSISFSSENLGHSMFYNSSKVLTFNQILYTN